MSFSPNFRGAMAKGSSRQLQTNYPSGSVSTMTKGIPVSITVFSQIVPTDVSSEASVKAIVGLLAADLVSAATGPVVNNGRLESVTTSFSLGDALYVGKSGNLINTKPTIGSYGFVSGDFVIFIGVVVQNEFNSLLTDIQLLVNIVGQL